MPDSLSLEERKELQRIYQIMYEHGTIRLATAEDGTRWLTDQFVLLDVTDSLALGSHLDPDDDCLEGCICTLEDGLYKLIQSKGLQPREGVLDFDVDGYFNRLDGCEWFAAAPSEWSVAEHPGKAMLWATEDRYGSSLPALLGESTWAALRRHHEKLCVEWTPDLGGAGLFRFMVPGLRIVAYAAGIFVPEGQEDQANALSTLTFQLATR